MSSLEIWELGQNSNSSKIAFDELTDIRMYLYVGVDWTRIHQYLKRFYFEAQSGGGAIKLSGLFKGVQKIFRNILDRCVFDIRFQFQEFPPTGGNKLYFP